MKKRIMALLLSLVMALSLVPTTVWAAGASTEVADDGISVQALDTGHKIDVRFTVLYVGDEFNIGYNYGASEKTQFVCQYSQPHSDTAYTNHTIAISDIKAAADRASVNSGYQIVGWSKEANANPKTWGFNISEKTTACNKGTTIYLVAKNPNPQVEFKLNYNGNATGVSNVPESQTTKSSAASVEFTISSQEPTRNGYDFLGWSIDSTATTATYRPSGKITVAKNNNPTTLYAVWEKNTPDPGPGPTPDNPGPGDKTPDMTNLVTVKCVTANANHDAKTYDVMETGLLSQDGDNYKYTVTLIRQNYINKYSQELDVKHTDATSETKIELTWTWEDGKWVKNFANPVIKCECKTEIVPPTDGPSEDDVKAALGNLTVKCVNSGTTHTACTYSVLGGNDGYTLTKNEDGTYNVVVNAAPFVKAYSKSVNANKQAHELVSAATLTWVLTFNTTTGKWEGKPETAGVDDVIQVAHRVPVHVVIYRNGDTSKAYADIALNSELPGTVIDVTKLNIADYYKGNVEFYGWYDDGLWNIYKANVKDNKAAPTGLTTKTVNGWTNFKCMVYDLDKVVYFQSAEDLAAYQNDHSKTDGLLYTTTVRRGTALPTADAPTATRDGYTFKFWSREGQTADVTGQTVNGWTNLYANWEINTYNIAATLYMNGADSSVQETGKTYPWSHRYGGEYGKPIDYTDMFAALKAKALEVDAANEPYDAEIKLCFPKSDKLFNETIKTYGQDGAFWNPGVKNTAYIWGHATTSYQVIFNTGDGSKVDTQIVKYGDKATEPAEPNRYGYEFKGWFEEGATDAFDFKNGITHKTQLTAQWEKQTYTVKFDSMGGSKVDDQQVKYQDKANKPADPTKSGYTFAGWYTDNKCTKGNEFSFDTKITGDITLYAKWDVKRTGTNPDAKNPYIKDNTKKDDGKKVESGKTFDAGIAMYVGLSILSVTGSAVVIRKRKDF